VTGHDHGGLGDHNEGLFLFLFSFLIPRKKNSEIRNFLD
jgi:hypothetical protein